MNEVSLKPVGHVPEGTVCGELVVVKGLISPLGDIDPSTGHLRGVGRVGKKILATKGFTGSTVGPYVIYSLAKRGLAPRALIVEQLDANVVASAVIAGVPLFTTPSVETLETFRARGNRLVCVEGGRLRVRGMMIAVEGIDGSGKTTVAKHLLEELKKCGYHAVYTYEPYYDVTRRVFETGEMKLTPVVEALLMVADRYAHYEEVVRREVESGKIVILDRYKHSTLAYQGAAGVPMEWLRELQKYLPDPDLGIYLDVEPELGLERKAREASRSLAYFEKLERLRRAREVYIELSSRGELVLVNSSVEISRVVSEVLGVIEGRLGLSVRGCSSPQ